MSNITNLIRIQKLDLKVNQIEKQIGIINDLISNNVIVRAAIQEKEQKEKTLNEVKAEIKRQEASLDELILKIQHAENSLYKGSNFSPKELQEIQQEIAGLKNYSSLIENKLLELMGSSDEINLELVKSIDRLTELQNESSVNSNGFIKEKSQLMENHEVLSKERSAIASAISQDEYKKYQDLRQQKRGIAITSISEGACDSCGNTLTPAMQQKVKTSSTLVQCPFCGRILYSET